MNVFINKIDDQSVSEQIGVCDTAVHLTELTNELKRLQITSNINLLIQRNELIY